MLFKKYYTGNKLIIYTSIIKNKRLFVAYIDSNVVRFILYDTNKNITKLPFTIPFKQSSFFKDIVCDNEHNIYVINYKTNIMHIILANGEKPRNIKIKNPVHLYRIKNTIYCLYQPYEATVHPSICSNEHCECDNDCNDIYTLSKFDLISGKFTPIITNINQFVIDCTSDTYGNLYLSFFPKDGITIIKKYSINGNIINGKFISYPSECFILNMIIDSNNDIYLFKLSHTDIFTTAIEKYSSKGAIKEIIYNHSGNIHLPETFTFMTLDKNNNLYYSEYKSVYKHSVFVENNQGECEVLTPEYNPIPTHIGYRSSHCISVYSPNEIITPEMADIMKQQYKGNILQHKENSANYSKSVIYSKIMKGQWSNRKRCYASQGVKYTNPNTNSFVREGGNNILLNGVQTYYPTTCPPYSNLIYYNSNQRADPKNGVIANGGIFICNKQENKCTGYSNETINNNTCFLTSCSDVPGKEQLLCYKQSQLYYPNPKRIMTNVGGKFPVNYKPLPCSSANAIPSQAPDCVY